MDPVAPPTPGPTTARATACGKVILLGEHAVVYGVPALAAGIDRGARAEVTLRVGPDASSTLALGGRTVIADAGADDDLPRAFAALLQGAQALEVTASSDLPPGGGLGSSAAIGVAIARAVEQLLASPATGCDAHNHDTHNDTHNHDTHNHDTHHAHPAQEARDERVMGRALAWERVFHGNPSGIDTYAAAHGGSFRFTRGEPARPLHLATDLWLAVGLSGSSASTRAMVEGLARLFKRKPDVQRKSIDAIAALVSNAALTIEAGDLESLGKLMDLNHMLLAGLFLSTEPLERLCHLARTSGALGAKLTGSGGGGSVIALVPPPEAGSAGPSDVARAVVAAWKSAGYDGFVTRIAAHP